MRPAASDYGLFGAGVQVHWLRQGGYAGTRHVQLAHARRRARRGPVADAHAPRPRCPSGTQIAYDTRSGATAAARRRLVGMAARGRRRRDRQPGRALHPVPRPHGEHHRRRHRPRSTASQITFGAGADRAPVHGHRHGRAVLADDEPDAHRHAERLQRPGRRPAHLPLPLAPQRHGDPRRDHRHARPVAGRATATAATSVRVEVYATDGRGAASDPRLPGRDRGQHRARPPAA